MIHKGILQTTELRLVVRPYLQITTTSLLGLGLLGGWAGPNWLRVLAIAAVLMATIVWIGRRARLRGAKPVYVYASAVINLAASAVIVLITGGARSPFWLLFLVGAIASAMSFRGRAGSNLERLNTASAAGVLLGPELMARPLDGPGLALAGMQVLTLFMSGEMIRKITTLLLESRETLRESEERYRMLIDTARDVIFSLATDGTFTSLNPSFETFTGWSRAEWLGRSFEGLIAEADRPRALDLFKRVLRGETLRAIRLRAHTRAGETLVVELNMSPQTQDGRAVGLLGIARDMTEEQRAEDALKASEKRFRALIENSTDAVSLLNANGTILYASPATTRVLGYAADEMVGRNVFELLHPDDMPNVTALFAQILQSPGAMVTAPARYRHKAGEWRWYEGTGHNLLAEQSVQAVVVNYRDVTERKQAEKALREANARLTELDALKTKFVSDVSHELRTPVANLKLYLSLVERGRPEKRAQYMTVLQEQTIRLARLIEDILDLSRLERDRERLMFEPVELNVLADRVVTAQLPRAEAAGLRLTFDPDLDLPPLRGETNRLTQVITNLVANAINYTPSGSVQVSTRCAGERVCVEVQDTGLGIDADDLPHIFERFYRGWRATESNIPGTGLGLSIVKEIVALHGGTVEVESRMGEGSTFRVWLPV